jgi:beta-galactosidase
MPTTAQIIGKVNNEAVAVRNKYGKGEVLWIPSLIGLGSRMKDDYNKLSILLNLEAKQSIANVPFRFAANQPKMLMKMLQSGSSYIAVVINKSKDRRKVFLKNKSNLRASVLFADQQGKVTNNVIEISPEETMVIEWK